MRKQNMKESNKCFLCEKEFKGPVIYYIGDGNPVCSWKCLYKQIKKKYRKILKEPLLINQPKKRGRKKKVDGQELGKEQEKEKDRKESSKQSEGQKQRKRRSYKKGKKI